MRISILTIALSSVLLLTNCGKIVDGHWVAMERDLGAMPTGYSRSPEVAAPTYLSAPTPVIVSAYAPVVKANAAAQPEGDGAQVWNEIGSYDAAHPSLPPAAERAFVQLDYADASVFPVDGDTEPYADMKYDFTAMPTSMPIAPENRLTERTMQQVFFGYGSSRVESADRQRLKELAANIKRDDRACKVNVTGHASKRVDHVMDPVRRKMINFVMAQKRANAVAHEMYKDGVTPDWVMIASRGEEAPNPNPGGLTQEAADRRVDVSLESGSRACR